MPLTRPEGLKPTMSSASPFVFAVEEGLPFLMLGTMFSSFLIPIAIVLFYFSTPRLRRQPVFILNILAIILGLCQGIVNFVVTVGLHSVVTPKCALNNRPCQTSAMFYDNRLPTKTVALAIILYVLVPFCVEIVLVLKLLTVYPPRLLPRSRCIALYGLIAFLKCGRAVNAAYAIFQIFGEPNKQGALIMAELLFQSPNVKLEWGLQLLDDT